MRVDEFERWWSDRDRAEIVRMIAATAPPEDLRGGDACRARAAAELDVLLRRRGRQHAGLRAAHRLRLAVVDACRRTGVLDDDHDGAVRLARAAGEAARALVCGAPGPDELLVPFRAELALAPSA